MADDVVGSAFVAVVPVSAGFGAALESQLQASGIAQKIESSLSTAGVAGGAALSKGITTEASTTASTLEKQFTNAGIGSSNAFANKFRGALKLAGLDSGPAFTAAFAVAAFAGLAEIGEQFANLNKQIQNETGATGDALTSLATSATEAFRQVPVSLSTAGEAVDELRRRGVPLGEQLTQLATQELFLAKITKSDLGDAVSSTTALMARFNVPLSDQSRELDVLFKGYQQSGQSLGDLTSALQSGGLTLQAFGFNLDQSTSLLANLEKHGASLQPILAGLRLAFGKITSEGGDPQKVLAALVKEFTDGTPAAKAAADAINLFGKRSGAELSQQLAQGNFSVSKLFDDITNGKGGIVATGLSTLTLGDQFKKLRNNIEVDLSGAGTVALQSLESALSSLAGPAEALVTSIAHLGVSLAPVIELLGVGLVGGIKLAGPIINDLAVGIDAIASALGVFHDAGTIAVLGLGAIVIGLGAAQVGFLGAGAAAEAFTVSLLTNPIFDAVAAIALLGVAVENFGAHERAVKAEGDDLAKSFEDVGKSAAAGSAGVATAASTFKTFLDTAIQAGKLGQVSDLLAQAGSTTGQLTTALTTGGKTWTTYKDAIVATVAPASNIKQIGLDVQARTGGITLALNDQAKAYIAGTKAAIDNAAATGGISAAQKDAALALVHGKDDLAGYSAALNLVNSDLTKHEAKLAAVAQATPSVQAQEAALAKQLAAGTISTDDATTSLTGLLGSADAAKVELALLQAQAQDMNQAQDQLAARVAPTTDAYSKLADQLASGTITADDAATAFHGIGFSLTGAPAAVSALQSAVDSFVSSAVGKLPSVASALEDIASAVTQDQSSLQSDLQKRIDLAGQLGDKAVSTSTKSQQQLATINLRISNDQQNLDVNNAKSTQKLATDQLKRDQIIQNAAKSQGGASDSLRQEIAKNNAAIIADQKKLADDTSPEAFTKKLLQNAETIVQFTKNLQILVKDGLSPLAGQLASEGPAVAGGLAKAFAGNESKAAIANAAVTLNKTATDAFQTLLQQNAGPLTGLGAQQGNAIGKAISDGLTAELLKNFPFLKSLGVGVGDTVTAGATDAVTAGAGPVANAAAGALHSSLSAIDLRTSGSTVGAGFANATAGAIHKTLGNANFATDGTTLAGSLAEGFLAGIVDKSPEVLLGVDTFGGQIVEHLNKQFQAQSPSKVTFELGQNVAQGLANGITAGTSTVTDTGSVIAASFLTNLGQAFSSASLPPIDPPVAPVTISASLAPIAPPVIAPVTVGAHLAPFTVPAPAPLTLSATLGTVAPPVVSPVTIAASLSAIPQPSLAPVNLDVHPQVGAVPPVTVPATLAELAVPHVDPITIESRLAPIPTPTVSPVVVPASLSAVLPPRVDPVVVSVSAAPVAPVVVPATLAPLTAPVVPATVIPASLSAIPTPTVNPIVVSATLGRVPAPVVAPVVVSASLGPVTAPVVAPVTIDAQVPPVTVSASLAPLTPPVLAPIPATVAITPPAVDPVVVGATLAPITPPVLAPLQATIAPLDAPTLAPIQARAVIAPLDTAGVDKIGRTYGATIGAGIASGIAAAAPSSGTVARRFTPSLPDITAVAVPLGKELANGLFGAVDPDSEAAKKFLAGLAQLPATPAEPVKFTATPTPVGTADVPQHRADAEQQVTQARGLFDGATIEFPDKTDPLHIAHELAWIAHGFGIET